MAGGFGQQMAMLIAKGATNVDMSKFDVKRFHASYIGQKKFFIRSSRLQLMDLLRDVLSYY